MKINISRQSIYLLGVSVFLLIFVLMFSFLLLIPEGKEYRIKKSDIAKEMRELRKYEDFRDEIADKLSVLSSDNRRVITAFDKEFDAQRFEKINSAYFNSLKISKQSNTIADGKFNIYEVNTTSEINSPKSFYDFLEAVNKSDWIIGINFPINFKREDEMIRSSFTMRVYSVKSDSNSSLNLLSE